MQYMSRGSSNMIVGNRSFHQITVGHPAFSRRHGSALRRHLCLVDRRAEMTCGSSNKPHLAFAKGLDRSPVALAGAGRIATPMLATSSIGLRRKGGA